MLISLEHEFWNSFFPVLFKKSCGYCNEKKLYPESYAPSHLLLLNFYAICDMVDKERPMVALEHARREEQMKSQTRED